MLKALITIAKVIVPAVILLFGGFVWTIVTDTRRPNRYLIPNGYIGQVRVECRVKGASKLPIEDGHYLLKVSNNGRLQTSSVMQDGWASDQYYYVSKQGRHQIKNTGLGGDGMVWAGSFEPNGGNEQFFIGTQQQWSKADGREGPIPDGPLDPKTLLPRKQKHQ